MTLHGRHLPRCFHHDRVLQRDVGKVECIIPKAMMSAETADNAETATAAAAGETPPPAPAPTPSGGSGLESPSKDVSSDSDGDISGGGYLSVIGKLTARCAALDLENSRLKAAAKQAAEVTPRAFSSKADGGAAARGVTRGPSPEQKIGVQLASRLLEDCR